VNGAWRIAVRQHVPAVNPGVLAIRANSQSMAWIQARSIRAA
jgi:hypothetical protein